MTRCAWARAVLFSALLAMPPCKGQVYNYFSPTVANVYSLVYAADVVATSNVTLSGLQTIDGQAGRANEVVLNTAQSTSSQNGPWLMQVGAWTRPPNFPTGFAVAQSCNLTVLIESGTANAGTSFALTTAGGVIVVGTTAQTWTASRAAAAAGGANTQVQFNSSGTLAGDPALTYQNLGSSTNLTLGLGNTAAVMQGGINPGAGNGSSFTFQGQNAGATGNSGNVNFTSAGPTEGNSGTITIQSGSAGTLTATNHNSGSATIQSGSPAAGGNSGAVNIRSSAGGGNSGAVSITSGAAGATGNSGSVTIGSGGITSGTTGNVIFLWNGVAVYALDGAATTGAQVATFAATNKPGSATTAPTLWLPVLIGGTQYYIPLWQ